MKIHLVDGRVRFLTHEIEWKQHDEHVVTACYSAEEKDELVLELEDLGITPLVTDCEQPSVELLQRCEGKKFNTIQEAREFINSGIEPLTLEILAEAVADIIGGAV